MNIAVIGLGSMGKRRIRHIKDMYPDYTVVGVDGREDRRAELEKITQIKSFSDISKIDLKVDCAFICTPPLTHASIITECLNRRWNVFTELNLIGADYKTNMALARKNGCALFISSTFFYREEIKYIDSVVKDGQKWNYIYHIGQYLPDWHPWESYKDFFIGDKRTNGCREILAIELPWLLHTFGAVKEIKAVSDKMTRLCIDFDDNYMIHLIHENGNKGTLIADVVSPVAVRKLEAYSEGKYLSWNGTPDSVCVFDSMDKGLKAVVLTEQAQYLEGYSSFVVENAYKNEIRVFFDVVLRGKKPRYSFEQDLEVLKLIDSIGA